MATFWERTAHSVVDHGYILFVFILFVILLWVLTAPVPGHCILVVFRFFMF